MRALNLPLLSRRGTRIRHQTCVWRIADFRANQQFATDRIKEVVTAPRSPCQNPPVERVIGSIRRECLDHIVIVNEHQLRRVLSSYVDCYQRTHASFARQGLPGPAPNPTSRGRKSRRHPSGRRPASPRRTPRRLIRLRFLLLQSLRSTAMSSSEDRCFGGFALDQGSAAWGFRSQPVSLARINSIAILAAAQNSGLR